MSGDDPKWPTPPDEPSTHIRFPIGTGKYVIAPKSGVSLVQDVKWGFGFPQSVCKVLVHGVKYVVDAKVFAAIADQLPTIVVKVG